MAPGLNGRQTGTVPKNKPRNSGSWSHRSAREALIHSSSLDWEPVSDSSNRSRSHRKSSTTHSEAEADSLRYEVDRSRSSTMSQHHLVDNDNGEVSWPVNYEGEEVGRNHRSNASPRQSSHRSRQLHSWMNNQSSASISENACTNSESPANATRMNVPDRKQVMNKLTKIQDYIQQTASLMEALKVSDTPASRTQYDKLSRLLDDLKDSETKLKGLMNNMDRTESRIDDLLADLETEQLCLENGDSRRMQKFTQIVNDHYGPISAINTGNGNNLDMMSEEELVRRSEESKKKLESLQKRKQDLLELQDKARRQLQEAQAEQGRLIARAGSLNQEISTNKLMDVNVQQLNQRLKNVQQGYNTRNQISENLAENSRSSREEAEHPDEEQAELSDAETDLQLVRDKMNELSLMKAQLSQIQKLMTSMNQEECEANVTENSVDRKDTNSQQLQQQMKSEQSADKICTNAVKLEEAKSKLLQLTQLLDIVQNAQNTNELPASYIQVVSSMVNDESSSTRSQSPSFSNRSQPRASEEITVETMQSMTRELEERTAAMKEERDKLIAARQELASIGRLLPNSKADQSLSLDEDSESEAPCLMPANLDSSGREAMNTTVSTEPEQPRGFAESSPYVCKGVPPRTRQRATWNAPLPQTALIDRRCKNEALSRNSNQSSARSSARDVARDGNRGAQRENARWSPSPSASFCDVGTNSVLQTQNQLEITGNFCERMLADSFGRVSRPGDLTLDELFAQHQMLTRTVAQCSQLLWLQQKQIIELRNGMLLQQSAMLQNPQNQTLIPNQPQMSVPLPNIQPQYNNVHGPNYPNVNLLSSMNAPSQNFVQTSQNGKINASDMQSVPPHFPNEYPDQYFSQGCPPNYSFPGNDGFSFDLRYGNFNRFNPASSNVNQNLTPNVAAGRSRVPSGMSSLAPEDSGALNNQVPPGNRANNYWDNFRSYSRQNLLSNTKSNEETDSSRRTQPGNRERPPRESAASVGTQNNIQSVPTFGSQQTNFCNAEGFPSEQYSSLGANQNARSNHCQITRSRSVEPQNLRITVKNESRSQENDSRNINSGVKNEVSNGARRRHPESAENIRSVRNDVGQTSRNSDNVNSSRNFVHLVRDLDNEETAQGNFKKRVEKSRSRNEGRRNLNNRSDIYNGLCLVLRDNVNMELANFIRANENRPHFLIQLFRDLQMVTTDPLRQRTLESIQETVNANNLTERANSNGANVNIIENRNNIHENRCNLNRNQTEDPGRIDELFCQLRENQNTIRQNIGSCVVNGSNLENSNLSNNRNLGNSSRNNLANEGLRDLRTYFEANLCNFGHNSTLENPNLSNIRENLTRRGPSLSDYENMNPKNVYLSMYDNIVEDLRRRNQDPSQITSVFENYRNFEGGIDDFLPNDFQINNDSNRLGNNQFTVSSMNSNFGIREENRFSTVNEQHASPNRFSMMDRGDNFISSRDFIVNDSNDSGIDMNFNNENRKRNFLDSSTGCSNTRIAKENDAMNDNGNEDEGVEGAVALPSLWERNPLENSFLSSLSISRNEMSSSFIEPSCESSFANCRSFQQSDNRDLAEADQSRNEESAHSVAESDSDYVLQGIEPESNFGMAQNQVEETESSYAIGQDQEAQAENGFAVPKSHETGNDSASTNQVRSPKLMEPESNFSFVAGVLGSPFEIASMRINNLNQSTGTEADENFTLRNSMSEPEGGFSQLADNVDNREDNAESTEPTESDANSQYVKNQVWKHKTTENDNSSDCKKTPTRCSTNKFRDNTFVGQKVEVSTNGEHENESVNEVTSAAEGCEVLASRESFDEYQGVFLLQDEATATDRRNTSPEAEADWEMENGLDEVPTRLEKNQNQLPAESSRRPT